MSEKQPPPLDVDELLSRFPRHKFESRPFSDGHALTWYFEDVRSFNEYVNPFLSLHRAFDDRRIVGISLRPADRLLEALNE